jgi:hypothetical protein
MTTQDLGRLAVAVTSMALGLHPETLGIGAIVAVVGAWRRHLLSWVPRRARHARLSAGEPVGTGVPESWP